MDLVVDPESLTWQWKDEDEYQHGRRLGLISDATHARVDEAAAGGADRARAVLISRARAATPGPTRPS